MQVTPQKSGLTLFKKDSLTNAPQNDTLGTNQGAMGEWLKPTVC